MLYVILNDLSTKQTAVFLYKLNKRISKIVSVKILMIDKDENIENHFRYDH
jgi:hypothetical protein